MKSISIIKIELTGVMGCIEEYTSEPSITAVMDALKTALIDNNFDIILYSCKEIDKWYGNNLSKVLDNQFVTNKNVHITNQNLIKEIISDFEIQIDYYSTAYTSQQKMPSNKNFGIEGLIYLLDRFHQVTIQLRDRYANRETIDVTDEYDVQDLLHAMLKVFFDDIRPEEWTPSYAGTSSRQDFLLKKEQLIIETKKTRRGLGNKELANELIIDITRYKEHPDCKSLVCFVYDPESRIKNPRGFENDMSRTTDGIDIVVCIRP